MEEISIENFFPKYPSPNPNKDEIDPYFGQDFYNVIFKKKEFYDNRLSKSEIPTQGEKMKHQINLARYMSSNTPYDSIVVIHEMGTGKTCAVIAATELIKLENTSITGAIVLAKGQGLLKNFRNELIYKCTGGEYIPEASTSGEMAHRMKATTRFYNMRTFATFASYISKLRDDIIVKEYSNKIIIIDEVHNIRIKDGKEASKIDTYKQIHRFLHLVKNCKILLLSGTPMKDSPEEISSIMNLILPMEKQLPEGDIFIKEYLEIAPGTDKNADVKQYIVAPDKYDELKERFKGYISFLKSMRSEVKSIYQGKSIEGLKKFKVSVDNMSNFQSKGYINSLKTSVGVDIDPRQASLFIYPDGSYGKKGFKKWVIKKDSGTTYINMEGKEIKLGKFSLSKDLKKELQGDGINETLNNIGKYSSKYKAVIQRILNNKKEGKKTFVYGEFVHGSGLILFSLLLKLVGMSQATGNSVGIQSRYAILTNETANDNQKVNIINRFNLPDNMTGDIISVIIGSSAISEGFSLTDIQEIDILTPHWNFSETSQAIARGIRLGSHRALLSTGINASVKIYLCVSVPVDNNIRSIDLDMYIRSEIKDLSIQYIMRLLKESAFDCGLNYFRNYTEDDKDGSRECEYMDCNYVCDGIDMDDINNGIPKEELDFSTYQLYYVDPPKKKLLSLIGKFLESGDAYLENIILEFRKTEFSEFDIRNVLQKLLIEPDDNPIIKFKDFNKVYSKTPIQNIKDTLENIFKIYFSIDFITLRKMFPSQPSFELLLALSKIINQSIRFTNKYGFPSYLKEQNNIYFLVGSLSDDSKFTSNYYIEYPNILQIKPYDILIEGLYKPKAIDYICRDSVDSDTRKEIIKTLDLKTQETILEYAIEGRDSGIENVKRDDVLNHFKTYIAETDKYIISTFLQGEAFRCFDIKKGIWKECNDRTTEKIKNIKKEKITVIKQNKYGYYGIENPETGHFCIRNLIKEKAKKTGDPRDIFPGQDCNTWDQMLLYKLIITVFKIDPPSSWVNKLSRKEMVEELKKSKYNNSNKPEKKASIEIFKWKGSDLYLLNTTEEDWYKATNEDWDRAIYWLKMPRASKKKNVTMCSVLKEWFSENGLYDYNRNCGVQDKTRIEE